MSLPELYQWIGQVKQIFGGLGYWQMVGLALYSYGIVLSEHSAARRVAEKLVQLGKVSSVQKRLERWLDNERISWSGCCRAWSRFVLRQYVGERIILLVDETKLGQHLAAMVVGLAYRGCCIPLAFWCYPPDKWPLGQVRLIEELLSWIAEGVPDDCVPLLQADRGIGTSPDLIRVVQALGWHYLFRVQGTTRFQLPNGQAVSLRQLVSPGGHWTAQGKVFKKAGWLDCIAHVLWELPYRQAWCLVTNAPDLPARTYAMRYWQEASFRDLKSDGWQWHTSHVLVPHHANLLLLVMSVAYALVLSLGTLAFEEPLLARRVLDKRCSVFRNGLRLWQLGLTFVHALLHNLSHTFFVFLDPASLKSVRC
jgi:hypothetical protein